MTFVSLRRASAVAAVLLTAACADAPVAPRTAASSGLNFSLLGAVTAYQADTAVTRFTVDPTSSTYFQVGSAHGIYFPAYSICDPAASTYGPTEWDKPCTVLTKPIVITAKSWTNRDGLPMVDFAPALRFTSRSSTDFVALGMAVDLAHSSTPAADFKILYCPINAACLDESLTDASLKTQVSPQYNAVYRRVKHFSGYNVSSGRESLDSSLLLFRSGDAEGEAPPSPSRTGHLMSSGRAQ